ncbi:MAG TPA: SusC/RagA family TonB-linked outer membrane protein [Flavisolibacter sp.]|nr:SusC/RagA family TonB-linked outer membrane protein [Flavisolibacter sp.]
MRRLFFFVLGMLIFSAQLLAQSRNVSGTVLDVNGQPVPNVSVRVVGTQSGTTTDTRGVFNLSAPLSAKSLQISSVGFVSQTVAIPAQGTVSVTLLADNSTLSTVVVTGYQRIKRSEYSGSATKITSDKVNFVPSASFDQILQGKAPGLLVTSGSGQPGTSARVQIRGASSINGGNAPLYVIDGMPVEQGVFQSINPDDFESVDVLRDAVATAQYGNRGSNGVIIATTKKGKAGKTAVTYNGQFGVTQPGQENFDMMNSAELLQFQEMLGKALPTINLPGWAYSRNNPANAGLPAATLAQYDRTLDSLRSINTNWKDVFQRTGSFQSHDLNLSGGSDATRYFLSGGYYSEDGIGERSDLKRYTVRANVDSKTDKLTFSFNSSAGYTRRNFIESENSITLANAFAATYLALPYQQLYNADGSYATGSGRVGPNAYARFFQTSSLSDQLKLLGSMSANYDITKNISLGGFAGIDYRTTTTERSVYPNTYASNAAGFPTGPGNGSTTGQGSYGNGNTSFLQSIVRINGGYHKVFAEKHDVDVQLISEYTREKQQAFNYTGYGIDVKRLNTPAAITPGTKDNLLIPVIGGSKTGRALYAGMALVRYTFAGKYTFNGSIRRDASSQLPEENRWQNFYAGGVTWAVLKENFANAWSKVSDLRVRLSYGTSANADGFPFGNFGYLPLYGGGTYNSGSTIIPSNAGNLNLKWEKIATLNLGVDFGFFKNRIVGSIDIYNKRGYDNLVDQQIPFETGFSDNNINAATVQNRGVELQLTTDVVKTDDFTWTVGGNVAYNKNKIVSLGQVKEFPQGTEIVRVGLPIGAHYAVKWAGVDAATGAPLYYTKDGKVTNVYSDDDAVAEFGTYNAPWIGGFNTSLKFKGFQLDGLFTFQEGFSRYNNQDFFQLNSAFALQGFNLRKEMLTIWQKAGDVTNIQSPLYQRQFSSKDVQDASFLRFRNLTLSYNFQKGLLNSTKVLNGARIFVQAQNLYTWTKWTGFDPEDDNNIAAYEYPTPRIYTLGLNVNFK